MWISIERDKLRQAASRTNCGVLYYLFDTTELIDCKYLDVVDYPVPGDPTATALGSSSISLSWVNTSSVLGISIERRTSSTEFAEIARGTAGETSYTDEGLDPETEYFYRLRYYNGLEAYHPSGEDSATTEAASIKNGRLYNWYAVDDAREIVADGWHVPTWDEIRVLIVYLGDETVAGGKLKEVGTTYWNNPNEGATNEVGFNGRGAGYRDIWDGGVFYELTYNHYIWASSESGSDGEGYVLGYDWNDNALSISNSKATGYSVRLIKDSTTLSHGETGTYTGNDGKIYNTICIGTQEWLSDNLAETKYRNGNSIPEVTDDATWAALETGAWCAYNNDHDNI